MTAMAAASVTIWIAKRTCACSRLSAAIAHALKGTYQRTFQTLDGRLSFSKARSRTAENWARTRGSSHSTPISMHSEAFASHDQSQNRDGPCKSALPGHGFRRIRGHGAPSDEGHRLGWVAS